MTIAYLGLGSNLGDRLANIQRALVQLEDCPGILTVATSCFYETEPLLPPGIESTTPRQEWYINAVIAVKTTLEPAELLETCLEIERELGRVRDLKTRWGPRVIDIDILFYGDEIITLDNPPLTIPHPHLHERAFVLVPMLELQPEFKHPVLNQTIAQLHLALEKPCDIQLYGMSTE